MGLDAQALTTLTREKFAESLVDNQGKTGVATMSEASEVAKSVISTYQQALIEGNPLILSRIGHLVILDKSARPGRNPKTGEAYEISARRTVSLRKIPLKDKPYLKRQDMLARLRVALSDFSKLNIEAIYDVFHRFIQRVLDKKHRIEFRGFGVFYPVVREAGEVRNPRTGEKTRSEERVKISFRPSRELLGELN
ncbi:MAG: hypothetical protein CL840_04600 [Crocinitomicaceae bacterium]|jgi:Bacterial nucleoid DNA-binding protein|nr:hypothetical protein [Crocinitomicaceae bacterium]|tara:strand:- start:1943 stop:2527 length:585 start_codon:yes stop_codon:yes gene_type:complete